MKRISKKLLIAVSSIAIAITLVIGVVDFNIDPPNPPTKSVVAMDTLSIDPPNPPTK